VGDAGESDPGAKQAPPPGALTALLRAVAAEPEPRDAEPVPLAQGTVVGRFEIVRELGRGAFGVVYEAKDRELGRSVALKIVRPGRASSGESQLAREAEAVARLSHPNLVTLYEVGRSEHGPFLVFELLRGKTLQERSDDGPIDVLEAVHVAVEVARGLAHAHAEGVVHRDLKPSNVFVTTRGNVKILDFGMAHAFGRRRVSGGTPAYMAPEQWEDNPEDERTDVFALGVMLHRMLAGDYPFPEGEGRWSTGAALAPRLEVPDLAGLGDLVGRMLEKVPAGRPRDGTEVLAALEPIETMLRVRPTAGAAAVWSTRRKATLGDFLAELKRRHVLRVTAGYALFSFAVLLVIEPVMHAVGLPDLMLKEVLVALAVGLPVAAILAWVYDLTVQSVKRTPPVTGPGGAMSGRSRLLLPSAVSAAALSIAVALYAWQHSARAGRYAAPPGPSSASADGLDAELTEILRKFHADARPLPPWFINQVRQRVQNLLARPSTRAIAYPRMKRYWPMISRKLAERGLPEELGYIAWHESQFDPAARTTGGGDVAGMWQFAVGAARRFGLIVDRERDDRLDPELSTQAAVSYLADLMALYGSESFMLAIAGYNMGEGKLTKTLRVLAQQPGGLSAENRNFWYLHRLRLLPEETMEMVPDVLAIAVICRDPHRYGLE
jgi:soluble lytic murein transglycosylase-like protein